MKVKYQYLKILEYFLRSIKKRICKTEKFTPCDLVKLSQVFESALLDSILKLAVIPVACAPFPTQILPSSQLCI